MAFDFNKIPLDDKYVFEQFSLGNTIGIFQFSSRGMTRKIMEMKPENITDLIILNAGYRPGALRSGMLDLLIKRKHGKKYEIDERLEDILAETYGIMIFQEQIMQVAIAAAGFSHEQADKLRKVIAKSKGKKEIDIFKCNFIDWSVANGFGGDKLWSQIVEFAAYGFNKGHSTSYALNAYWCMWLKIHYPKEFMLSLLTYSNDDNIQIHVEEAKRLGFHISTPKSGFSKAEKWIEKDDVFYAPYNTIKSIGEKVAKEAAKTKSKMGFSTATAKTKSQKLLRDAGCFSDNHDCGLFNFEPSKPKKNVVDYKKTYPNLFETCPDFFQHDIEDILNGNFPGELTDSNEKSFIKRIRSKTESIKCAQCDLKSDYQLKTSIGRYNVFVVKANPKDDIEPLWVSLKECGLNKKHFHVSSTMRCDSDTPNKSQIGICSQKVMFEMKQILCRLALIFDHVGYQAFTGKSHGIISGKCQWLEKYGLWAVFCSLPSDSFLGKENFKKGVEKFIEMFEKML